MGSVFLMGGGWDAAVLGRHLGAFLAAAGPDPDVACLVVDEGAGHGQGEATRWSAALTAAGPCRPRPVLVPVGGVLDPGALHGVDALLVCGGLTPAYAAALSPVAAELRAWLSTRPYAGFSAGAAVAAQRALVGGWRHNSRPVCPEDAAEDLDEVSVVDGLGLVPHVVEVHCAQWGTLGRLLVATQGSQDRQGPKGTQVLGVGLDENTMLTVTATGTTVSGTGHAWVVRADGSVTARAEGELVQHEAAWDQAAGDEAAGDEATEGGALGPP